MEVTDKRHFNEAGDRVLTDPEPVKHEILPTDGWVLIRKIEREETVSEGGVVIVGGGRSSRGEVVNAGDPPLHPTTGVPMAKRFEKGEHVIFTNFPIELEELEELTGEKNLKLVRYEEVYARIRKCT